jgi:hypothetical protein
VAYVGRTLLDVVSRHGRGLVDLEPAKIGGAS